MEKSLSPHSAVIPIVIHNSPLQLIICHIHPYRNKKNPAYADATALKNLVFLLNFQSYDTKLFTATIEIFNLLYKTD